MSTRLNKKIYLGGKYKLIGLLILFSIPVYANLNTSSDVGSIELSINYNGEKTNEAYIYTNGLNQIPITITVRFQKALAYSDQEKVWPLIKLQDSYNQNQTYDLSKMQSNCTNFFTKLDNKEANIQNPKLVFRKDFLSKAELDLRWKDNSNYQWKKLTDDYAYCIASRRERFSNNNILTLGTAAHPIVNLVSRKNGLELFATSKQPNSVATKTVYLQIGNANGTSEKNDERLEDFKLYLDASSIGGNISNSSRQTITIHPISNSDLTDHGENFKIGYKPSKSNLKTGKNSENVVYNATDHHLTLAIKENNIPSTILFARPNTKEIDNYYFGSNYYSNLCFLYGMYCDLARSGWSDLISTGVIGYTSDSIYPMLSDQIVQDKKWILHDSEDNQLKQYYYINNHSLQNIIEKTQDYYPATAMATNFNDKELYLSFSASYSMPQEFLFYFMDQYGNFIVKSYTVGRFIDNNFVDELELYLPSIE
jgi:hypothetical protein